MREWIFHELLWVRYELVIILDFMAHLRSFSYFNVLKL